MKNSLPILPTLPVVNPVEHFRVGLGHHTSFLHGILLRSLRRHEFDLWILVLLSDRSSREWLLALQLTE